MSAQVPSGGVWAAVDFPSPSRLNRKTLFIGSGSEIAALSPVYPNMVAICNGSSGTFVADVIYQRTSDNQSWVQVGTRVHTHNAATDSAGGMFKDVVFDNLENAIWLNKVNAHATMFETKNSGGSVLDQPSTGLMQLLTSATSGNYAGIVENGNRLDFSAKSKFIIKCSVDSNTYLTVKIGVGVDHANDPDTTNPQYGIDAVDLVNSPRLWEVRSSAGAQATSFQTSTQSVSQTALGIGHKCVHTPFQSVVFSIGRTYSVTKTTNVPSSGGTATNAMFQASIKTNTTIQRILSIYGLAIVGQSADTNDWG